MEKIWLKNYQAGVPDTIDINTYSSINELTDRACADYADKSSFTCMGKAITFADLHKKVRAFASYMQQDLSLQKGDRLAIMMPNTLQYPIALLGALQAGLTVVNINPLYTATELQHVLKDSGARAIVILENFASVLEEALKSHDNQLQHVMVTGLGDMLGMVKGGVVNFAVKYIKKMVPSWNIPKAITFKSVLDKGYNLKWRDPKLSHYDIAFLQYTGGTTGRSKGAMLTHGNMVANLLQARTWIGDNVVYGEESIITALPLYHIFSLTANCLTFMSLGAQNVLVTNPRDIPGFVKILSTEKFTGITGVNTLFNALLNNPEFKNVDFSQLKLALGGGMAVQRVVAERWKKVTGIALLEAYGLTETSPAVCINPLDLKDYNGSIGLPLSSTEVSVRSDDGVELEIGEVGELWVRGPQVMRGYWENSEETNKILTSDGWLRTGDIAKIDENGFVYLVDRKKDMINVSGFNVYPNEIEEVIVQIESVVEVGVVGYMEEGAPSEQVKAFVVRKDDTLTEDQIIAHARKHLTAYKVPKHIEFVAELPKTNVGKILRRALRTLGQDKPKVAV